MPIRSSAFRLIQATCRMLYNAYRSGRMGLYFTILVWLLNTSLCSVFISLAWKDSEPFGGPEWDVAMMQASQFLDGEHDYSKIQGPEGEPLLHPAGRLYLFSWLYYLTGGNVNKFAASIVFAAVYMATFTLVIFCYRKLEIRAPVLIQISVMSQMVNNHLVSFSFDCFAIFFLWLSIFSFQRGSWTAGTVAFTLALSISSHLLLALPALGIVMVLALGPVKAAKHVFAVLLYLVLMTAPFAQTPSEMKTHVAWLLNSTPWFSYENSTWKIFPQEFYYSGLFATMLRLALASSFTTFALCSWLRPLRQPFPRAVAATTHATSPLSSEKREAIASRVDADYIASTLIGAVFLQFMFAPSLSNSAFVYISWGAPVLWHFFPYVDSNLIMGLILGLDRGWTWFISGTTYAAVGMQCIFVFSLGTSFLKAASTDRQKKDKARQLELPRTTKGEKRTGPA